MTGLEVEFKYRADDIKLDDFMEHCKAGEHILASGWDHFYDASKMDGFARHRIGADFNQLTYKRKTTDKNNYIREEDNLDLYPAMSRKQVASFLGKFGYTLNRSIFKNCFIYKFPRHTLVYYIIYSEALDEIGRFIEIEMAEDHAWDSENHAWTELLAVESDFKNLGLTPQARMKKSLYELVCE